MHQIKGWGGILPFCHIQRRYHCRSVLRQLVQRQEWLQVKLSRLDKDEKTSVQEVRGDRDSSEANTAPGINSLREGRGNSQWVLEEDV